MKDGKGREVVTLRIKKMYYDLIKTGEKKVEYRDITDFYNNLLKKRPKVLKLHYQGKNSLLVEIKGIKKVKIPKDIRAILISLKIVPEKLIYAISLGKVLKEIIKK